VLPVHETCQQGECVTWCTRQTCVCALVCVSNVHRLTSVVSLVALCWLMSAAIQEVGHGAHV
jgi:hypothetical protein